MPICNNPDCNEGLKKFEIDTDPDGLCFYCRMSIIVKTKRLENQHG